MGSKFAAPTETDVLPPKVCWDVLERVATSTHLNRAARLREFLFYVGRKRLHEGNLEIHEQEIGTEVFGRQSHYDTSQDNIVRVNATELRKRIDAYFEGDGAGEPVLFSIPRGSYVPVFRWREEAVPAPAPVEPAKFTVASEPVLAVVPEAAPEAAAGSSAWPWYVAGAVAAAALVAVFLLWGENRSLRHQLHPWVTQPALASFWGPFLDSSHPTDVVLADTSFALVEDVTGQSLSLTDYMNHGYIGLAQSPDLSADRKADLALMVARPNGSVGDFRVAQRIQSLDPGSPVLDLQFAREYTADSIKQHNVILIGSRKSNPWVDLFSDRLNFSVDYDPKRNQSFIRNHKPQNGELAEYAAPVNPYASAGYSVIAFLPNPSHTANALIIAGTDSQATDAAGEFLTTESTLADLLHKFPGKQTPYFEVLLKTTRLSGTPFSAEIVAFRTY